jgi:hypothetical protein
MDPDSILDYLKNKQIMDQANAIGQNRMGLPKPQQTDSPWKDFLINSMGAIGNLPFAKTGGASKPYTPQAAPPPQLGPPAPIPGPSGVAGGKDFGIMDGVYSNIHNPRSALDIKVRAPEGAIKDTLGGPTVNARGIAENFNRPTPKVNDVIDVLTKEGLDITKVHDSKAGTSYVSAKSPRNPDVDKVRVRVPLDEHAAGRVGTDHEVPGNFFDLGTKRTKAGNKNSLFNRNRLGEHFGGGDPDVFRDAIRHRFTTGLVSEGKEPRYYKSRQESDGIPPKPEHIDDMIDRVLAEGNQPTVTKPKPETHPGFDWSPGQKQPISVEPRRAIAESSKPMIYTSRDPLPITKPRPPANENPAPKSNVIDAEGDFFVKSAMDKLKAALPPDPIGGHKPAQNAQEVENFLKFLRGEGPHLPANSPTVESFKGPPVKTPLSKVEAHDLSYHKGDVGPLTEHVQRDMNVLHKDEFPNMRTPGEAMRPYTKSDNGQDIASFGWGKKAANTGEYPKDPLITKLEQTQQGRYSLALTDQKLKAKGINPEGMSYIQKILKLRE